MLDLFFAPLGNLKRERTGKPRRPPSRNPAPVLICTFGGSEVSPAPQRTRLSRSRAFRDPKVITKFRRRFLRANTRQPNGGKSKLYHGDPPRGITGVGSQIDRMPLRLPTPCMCLLKNRLRPSRSATIAQFPHGSCSCPTEKKILSPRLAATARPLRPQDRTDA